MRRHLAKSKGRVFYDPDGNAVMLTGPAAADPFDAAGAAERFDALAAFLRVSPPAECPGDARTGRTFPDARGNAVIVSGPIAAAPFRPDAIAAALEDIATALLASVSRGGGGSTGQANSSAAGGPPVPPCDVHGAGPLRGNHWISDIHRNGECTYVVLTDEEIAA